MTTPAIHHFHDILEPTVEYQPSAPGPQVLNHKTQSQGTMSTRSTTSQNSWEEDRSVGGEVEEVTIETLRIGSSKNKSPQNSSLHETHFDETDLDLPRTVLHHPDPYGGTPDPFGHGSDSFNQSTPVYYPHSLQRVGRPFSSADTAYYPYYPLGSGGPTPQNAPVDQSGRPTSAMSFPADSPYAMLPTRRMPTPNGQLTTSVKSVFDCDQGCFVDLEKIEDEHEDEQQEGQRLTKSAGSTPSRTSEPRDV